MTDKHHPAGPHERRPIEGRVFSEALTRSSRSVISNTAAHSPISIMMNQADTAKTPPEKIQRRELDGSEPLPGLPQTVLDYWKWAYADMLENVQRGIFAEFLVGVALGITGETRVAWADYDLNYGEYKIEVKSSAYLQAWFQPTLSKISFGIGPKRNFDLGKGEREKDPRFAADCFVFCVYDDKDRETADVLDATRWHFYVVPSSRLIEYCKTAKSVVENRVKQITSADDYNGLRQRIDATRDGQLFPATSGDAAAAREPHGLGRMKTFAVWERGTRLHPVIVRAANVADAYLLGRADPTLAALGTTIAGNAVSRSELAQLLADGAVDLR
jgi:hypothetical protein